MPVVAAAFSIEQLARDLIGMLDDAGVAGVHWVGNSLGGIVALEMLAAGRFRSLVTFGTLYSIRLPQIGGHRLIAAGHRLIGRDAAAALTARTTTRDPAARTLVQKMLHQVRPEVTATLAGVLTRYDLIAKGSAATLPILMLRGSEDRMVNAGLAPTLAAMRGRPNFELVDLPGGGHCANLDARDAFRKAVLAFWTRCGASPGLER
jgi:pimeloyl-ACP methyl ester carboxylesterase